MEEIPVSKAQLQARISGDSFDRGKTAAWLADLEKTGSVTWRAVRDSRTGHTIHVVSDRPFIALKKDLLFGLQLLNWLSSRPITWYWWDQPWVRVLPANVDPGRDHVNGGWATPGVLEVHVYRREEAHKVMLHECIHALGLDVSHEATIPVRKQFEAACGRTLWPHLGEAFTELFAEWLWSIASASSLADATKKWRYQLACSERQAAQVWTRIRDSHENETTNVFAYYVLKWVLMQHLSVALLESKQSVASWFTWWSESKPTLDMLADQAAPTESESLSLGMTCPGH
jgi:hypothetical protein